MPLSFKKKMDANVSNSLTMARP